MDHNTKTHCFQSRHNIIEPMDESDYDVVESIIKTVKSFECLAYERIYIIDYYKNEFLYTSHKFGKMFGIDSDDVKKMGYRFYIENIAKADMDMLLEIKDKSFQLFYNLPIVERLDYRLLCNFNVTIGGRRRLICHKLTPLALTKYGKLWLAMCTVSFATGKDMGDIVMKKLGSESYFRYSIVKHEWEVFQEIELSDKELEVLMLTTQGFTMSEIANMICKSIDTIKTYKKNIFHKMGVSNIAEALTYVQNHQLI